MSTKGNRGFAASIVGLVEADTTPEPSAADEIMDSRSQALGRLATGKVVADRTEFVDPARCRPWRLHNRDLDKLNEENCADLIDAFKSAGRQRIPAVVRRLRGDPDFDFEIVAGVRRWWTTRWLREHHHPEFEYLVTIQNMTDEEAFRVADLENRARRDISPIERAQDYLRAIDEFYDGSQLAMAERLNVSKSWLSRILDVGRLPAEVIAAFPDSHQITVKMAKVLAPLARSKETSARLSEAAEQVANERKAGGAIDARAVVKRLVTACADPRTKIADRGGEISSASGRPMLRYSSGTRGGLDLKILPTSGASHQELMKAIDQVLKARSG
jgi:ParB family chromosome partitioning protein